MNRKTKINFWDNVDMSGGETACWPWQGTILERGQGQFNFEGKTWRTKPLAYYLSNKVKPETIVSLCKNKACCNPKHIKSVSRKEYDASFRGNTEEDFWKLVNIKSDNECWLWMGHTSPSGYGIAQWKNSPRRAHRLAYFYKNGVLNKTDLILHSCHERRCCNPLHLRAGTHEDNMKDMVAAKRAAVGSRNGLAKLTEKQVIEIRKIYRAEKISQRKLAKQFKVNQAVINDILLYKTWRHV